MWESVGSRVASMAYGNAGPYLFGLSLASSLNVIGAWMIVTPCVGVGLYFAGHAIEQK